MSHGYCERCTECQGAIWIRVGSPDDAVAVRRREREGFYVAESVKDKAEREALECVGHAAICSRKRKE